MGAYLSVCPFFPVGGRHLDGNETRHAPVVRQPRERGVHLLNDPLELSPRELPGLVGVLHLV